MNKKYDPFDLKERLTSVIKTGLKSACLSPTQGSELFMSFIIDDLLDELYHFDMMKYGGRNVYRKRLKEKE